MPTRCNRGFYSRSYCLLNMFRASLCPPSGAQEYYTVVVACGISCCKNVNNNFVSFCGICVLLHLVGILFPHIISVLLSKVTQRQPTRQNSDIYNAAFLKNTKILPILKMATNVTVPLIIMVLQIIITLNFSCHIKIILNCTYANKISELTIITTRGPDVSQI